MQRARDATELALVEGARQLALPTLAICRGIQLLVEGAESRDRRWWAVAVQWHPEELTDGGGRWDRALFAAFAERVRTWHGATAA